MNKYKIQTEANSHCILIVPYNIVFCVFLLYFDNFSQFFHIRKVTNPFCAVRLFAKTSSLSFGLLPIRGRFSRYLHFYTMAFVLLSDAFAATNPLFIEKTGLPVFHIKVEASH